MFNEWPEEETGRAVSFLVAAQGVFSFKEYSQVVVQIG